MQNRKGDTDVQNRLLDSLGEGEGGMFRGNSIKTCILSRVKQITSPGWMHETSARAWCTGTLLLTFFYTRGLLWSIMLVYLLYWSTCVRAQSLSRVQLSATPWTVAHQAPLSMAFSRQAFWSGLPCPPPGHLPHPGVEPISLASPALCADSLPLSHLGSPYVQVLIDNVMVLGDGDFKSCLGHDNELQEFNQHSFKKDLTRHGKNSPSEPPQGTQPGHTWILVFWLPEWWE